MGLADFFKRKQPKYDSTNIRVTDLDVGFVFEYDLESWEVQASYEYDWGDNYFSKEYKINNGTRTLYLAVEDDDEISLSISDKIKVRELGENVLNDLMNLQKAPTTLIYKDTKYFFEKESPGYFNDTARGEEWVEFISWDFEDESGENIITIEQWDEKEFEASAGKAIKEFEISNILPK
ncbi:DUF4178 domain-containing protein [Labilibaculum sp. DW002]|uniref:DUF4178 domain-containing protein n=1 Tax=Paralabilibaculum antarcticum TaxID=2912572 RepID=A0ABT5VX46_9BACT|nr:MULTISPECIES: DUF4178 domain-containing protein [unclassified Labilibaculum]MBI9057734.1 DUF4178 domain-containing protein [Labilibaculum sp.]MDE5419337.1 DUF4178 domain-containing protein [Labilibaculum sp. DW002]